jgi:anaerobic selenocysteine-containing dehydrogenase
MEAQLHHAGMQKVILSPDDAAARGITSGDPVRIFNERGAFEAVAEVSTDATAGVVVAPMGYWPRNNRQRRTVSAINPPAFADYGHAPTFSDTLVEVMKSVPAAAE